MNKSLLWTCLLGQRNEPAASVTFEPSNSYDIIVWQESAGPVDRQAGRVQKIVDTRYAAFSRGAGGAVLIGLGVWMLAR